MNSFDDTDDMCPNCQTPWKCNGPHLVGETQRARQERFDAMLRHDHRWSEPEVWRHHTGPVVSVQSCPCGLGSVVLPEAPRMTHSWLIEHLDGVKQVTSK